MVGIGRLTQVDGVYEFRDPGRSLIVRGAHLEWVLLAAAEIIGDSSRLEGAALVDELTAMVPLGAADAAELAAARVEHRQRFDISPRCGVAFGTVDYVWTAPEGPRLKPDEFAPRPLTLGPEMLVTRPG